MPRTDQRFGPYRILGKLGAGGMGEVFLARDPRLERDVVLKMLPAEVADDAERMARFRHEALALAAVNHPNIATIFGFEESDAGVLALVLERVEGVTLAERLRGGAMPQNDALRVCAQIAEALEAAHARGVIHRDLKPQNVMLAPSGLVKVLDFGLAQRVGEASSGARSTGRSRSKRIEDRDTVVLHRGDTPGSDGEVSGSPGYMSPEQARGELQDQRTDVFAFGCVLFECLTGLRAVEGETIVEMMTKAMDTTVDLSALPESTSPAILTLLDRCLERDVSRRLAEIHTARVEIEEVLGIRRASALRAGEQVAAAPHHLPFQATPFVARKRAMDECIGLLRTTRLLTITGVGGGGKTRLAMRLAEMLTGEFADGVWFVDLAQLNDPEHVSEAVATALGVGESPGLRATEAVGRHLAARRALIVLDGCEHLLAACGELARAQLAATPHVKMIATSRESLGVPGETTYTLPPMSLPDAHELRNLESIRSAEAVELFLDRASAVRPSFVLDAEQVRAVVEICRQLDGIPLAIELAAARMRVLSVEQILARLHDRFRLLAGGNAALARHQTLRASIQWSYDQLTADEQRLLRTVSVFAGGWTLEAATACAEDWDEFEVLDLLARLVEKSLVVVERIDGEDTRYRCLESVRQYASDLLREAGEARTARNRHRDWCAAFAQRASKHTRARDQVRWYDRVEAEIDNLRAALEWCREDPDGAEPSLRLVAHLGMFWALRGYCREGRQWVAETLARTSFPPSSTLASALLYAGHMAYRQDDLQTARDYYRQSLDLRRQLGDEAAVPGVLGSLGNVAQALGQWQEAKSLFEETLESNRRSGNRIWLGTTLTCLGNVTRYLGDIEASRAYLEEALAVTHEIGNTTGEAIALQALGDLNLQIRDFEAAGTYYEQAMAIQEKLGDRHSQSAARLGYASLVGQRRDHARSRALFQEGLRTLLDIGNRLMVGAGLELLAAQLLLEGNASQAARMLGAASSERQAIHSPVPPSDAYHVEQSVMSARKALGDEAYAAEWERGRRMSPEQAVEDVFGTK